MEGCLQKEAAGGSWKSSLDKPKRGLSSCGSGDPVGTITSLGSRAQVYRCFEASAGDGHRLASWSLFCRIGSNRTAWPLTKWVSLSLKSLNVQVGLLSHWCLDEVLQALAAARVAITPGIGPVRLRLVLVFSQWEDRSDLQEHRVLFLGGCYIRLAGERQLGEPHLASLVPAAAGGQLLHSKGVSSGNWRSTGSPPGFLETAQRQDESASSTIVGGSGQAGRVGTKSVVAPWFS